MPDVTFGLCCLRNCRVNRLLDFPIKNLDQIELIRLALIGGDGMTMQ